MSILRGLFSPTYGYIRTLTCLALGIVLVMWPDMAAKTLIMSIGGILIIVGGVSLGISIKGSGSFGNLMSFNGLFDILFGLVLIIFNTFFISLIMYVFGAIFIVFGISQITSLLSASRISKVPGTFYVLPALVSVCGFVLLFKPFQVQETVFVITGLCLIVYAVSEFFATFKVNRVRKAQAAEAAKAVEDATYEEVSSEITVDS